MKAFSFRAAAAGVASLSLLSSGWAQTTVPSAKTAPTTKTMSAEKNAEKPRTKVSLQCSKDADAKGIHGKERKKFMSRCKKAGADN